MDKNVAEKFMNTNKVVNIPIMTNAPKELYKNVKTYTLVKSNKRTYDIEKVEGLAEMKKFNPQDLGLPK